MDRINLSENTMQKKIVGIIGGLGPLATSDLFRKIILNTKAKSDQDHIRVIIDNNTQIPDRTSALLRGGESPLPEIIKSARLLCDMGADILIMPCHTSHYFHAEIQKRLDIPLLNMVALTRDSLLKGGIKKAALLATEGTVKMKTYERVFENSGIELLIPTDEEQKAVTDLIYKGVKAGDKSFNTTEFKSVAQKLFERGAEILILGCTELPLAMEMYNLDYNVCDPTTELARGAIIAANAEVI